MERELTVPPHQPVSRLVRESLAVVTNVFDESRTRNGGGNLRSLGVWLRKVKRTIITLSLSRYY